jgi:hypothetical protein
MFGYDASGKGRDFSAYYIAAWRFLNDPSTIYRGAGLPGQYPIYPHPATFKYPPFFILLIIPFLLTSYQSAIVTFNIIQFAMLPAIAVLIYKTMTWRNRSVLAMVPVLVLSLLAPLSAPQVLFLNYRVKFVEAFFATGSIASLQDGFSNAYYWQWVEGNARVFEMLLFFLAIFFATRKSLFSGVAFGLSTFDPRMVLIALPVTLAFNKTSKNLPRFLDGLVLTLAVNLPLALYSNIGRQFIAEALQSGPFIFYAYEWIPFYSTIAFTIINLDTVFPRLMRAWKRWAATSQGLIDYLYWLSTRDKPSSPASSELYPVGDDSAGVSGFDCGSDVAVAVFLPAISMCAETHCNVND